MKAKVAVATIHGKTYFFVVNELKRRNIPFLSLSPSESIPAEIAVVVTTQKEKQKITQGKILVYDPKTDPETLGDEVVRVLHGKENYSSIVIGVDPGEAFGVAIIADDSVIDTDNCFSIQETLNLIKRTLKIIDFSRTTVTVKIGSGVPVYRDLLESLKQELPSHVSLQIVGEAGTNGCSPGAKNRRGFRHMISATRIARRQGHFYLRRASIEQNS